ncbi:hypothetical protein LTS18_002546, partial [Coniosporium uncinatum]
TSASAFASSGFGALARDTASPFGSLAGVKSSASPFSGFSGQSKLSSFAAPTNTTERLPSSTTETASTSPALGNSSSFPGGAQPKTAGTSTFGTLGSGRGFSGGFGAVAGSGLSSFANPGGAGQIVGLQGGSAKFGAVAGDEEDDEGDDGDDEKSEVRSPKPDPERRVVGKGEEDEETEFQARAKLFIFTAAEDDKKKMEWKERGLGTLKFNVNYIAKKARLILRNDSTGRMVLNSPIQVNLDFGNRDAKPTNGLVLFQGCLARDASAEGEAASKDSPHVELLQLK